MRSVTSPNSLGSRDGAPVSGLRTWQWTTAAPAFAASIAALAISAGVIGTLSDLPVVSPDPVTAQVIKASRFICNGMLSPRSFVVPVLLWCPFFYGARSFMVNVTITLHPKYRIWFGSR
jgi:hypothetical protein